MYLLGIDLETTGIDLSSSNIIEIGYMIWDTSSSCPVKFGGYLIKTNNPIPEEIKNLTGIRNNHLSEFGIRIKTSSIITC